MPGIFKRILDGISQKDTLPVNTYEGFKGNGAVVLRDHRGTVMEKVPEASEKSLGMGDDPLAIWKPTGTKHVTPDKAMANFTGWTYAAVHAISMEAVGIRFRLYKIKGKKHEEVDEHELLDLLEMPNETQIGHELVYTTVAHLELTGNAFWYLDGVKNEGSKPTGIFPLNPGRMRTKLDKSSFPYKIAHYEYTIDGRIFTFQPEQILQIRYPDPNDAFTGIGFPQTIPTWIDSDNYAMEYNRKFFINGANIGLYVKTETNVEGNLERIKRGMRNEYAGTDNAHKIPVMPKGSELKHSGVTHKDMDFGELTDKTRDRILAAARVSKTILGTAESDTNRSTAETADYVFSKRTMKPKMQLITAFLNAKLVPLYGDYLYLTFIDPTPQDREFQTKEMQAATGNAPVMTVNEARKTYFGLGPIEGGDQLMTPTAMTPIGTSATPEGEDQAPQLAKTNEGWNTKAFRVRAGIKSGGGIYSSIKKELADLFKAKLDAVPAFQVKSITDLTRDEYMEHWKRFDTRTVESVGELIRVFKLINIDQEREVIKNLPETTGVEKSLGDLFDLNEWIALTVDLVTPILERLTRDEATAALAMIGAKHQDILADVTVREALDKGISLMACSYNETTLQQLKEVLGAEMTAEGGTTLQRLTDAVQGVYSFADEKRAERIAKTESYRASNSSNREAWKASGVVKSLIWFTAEDDHVCPYCQELDGTKVGIEDKFFNDDYADGMTPPRHVLCRCYVRPADISID